VRRTYADGDSDADAGVHVDAYADACAYVGWYLSNDADSYVFHHHALHPRSQIRVPAFGAVAHTAFESAAAAAAPGG